MLVCFCIFVSVSAFMLRCLYMFMSVCVFYIGVFQYVYVGVCLLHCCVSVCLCRCVSFTLVCFSMFMSTSLISRSTYLTLQTLYFSSQTSYEMFVLLCIFVNQSESHEKWFIEHVHNRKHILYLFSFYQI